MDTSAPPTGFSAPEPGFKYHPKWFEFVDQLRWEDKRTCIKAWAVLAPIMYDKVHDVWYGSIGWYMPYNGLEYGNSFYLTEAHATKRPDAFFKKIIEDNVALSYGRLAFAMDKAPDDLSQPKLPEEATSAQQ